VYVQVEIATRMARDGNSEKMTKRSRRRRCSTKTNVEGEQSRTLFTGPEFRGSGDEDTSSEPLSSSMTTNDLRVPPSTPLSPVHRRIIILNDEIPKRRFWFDDDINVRSTVLTVTAQTVGLDAAATVSVADANDRTSAVVRQRYDTVY